MELVALPSLVATMHCWTIHLPGHLALLLEPGVHSTDEMVKVERVAILNFAAPYWTTCSLVDYLGLLDSVDILDTFANLPTVCSGMLGY